MKFIILLDLYMNIIFYCFLYLLIIVLFHHIYLHVQDKYTKPIIKQHNIVNIPIEQNIPDDDIEQMNVDLSQMLDDAME